jgi:hypothetical protein
VKSRCEVAIGLWALGVPRGEDSLLVLSRVSQALYDGSTGAIKC